MSTQEKARQDVSEHRLQQQHRRRSMLERSEAEIAEIQDTEIQEETRESLTKQRQKEQSRKLSMKYRSEEDMK